jgi:XTP/dITP diphosphohydrolase
VRRTLLIATHNAGKVAEYRQLLADLPVEVTSLSDQGISFEAPETGDSFAANACQKATAYAALSGLWTWADDSGLEVDALGKMPGVLSARYGGNGLSDRDRTLRLLKEMEDVPDESRGARFRCVVCIVGPQGGNIVTEGFVEGFIARQPAGAHGFGYDPVFWLPKLDMTMAQLPAGVKNRISHRGMAARAAKVELSKQLDS